MNGERARAWRSPHRALVRLGLALGAALCLAPTPGDIGGCGQAAQDLDPGAFFLSMQSVQCTRCEECQIRTTFCEAVCSSIESGAGIPDEFPEGCFPLVHDGTVCLRALTQASCEDHREFAADPPSVPSECNFCPER